MLLFRTEYGSRAMGMGTEDSDHDVMEVHLEPPEYITGLRTWDAKHRSTAEAGSRSGAGDTDTTVYGLRHWAALAAKGNPTAMTPLFKDAGRSNDQGFEVLDNLGWRLMDHSHLFISMEAGRRFRGYALSQRDAMVGLRNKRTNRPELVHKHGYDTKFAYHALRTLMQGYELMSTGWVTLPIPARHGIPLRSIREGKVSKAAFLELFAEWDRLSEYALNNTHLPERADYDSINSLLHEIYLEGWSL